MDADGSRVRRVFGKSALRAEPTWAPDGDRIAFHAEIPQWSIQTATIHGASVEQVAFAEWRGGNPSWSADGKEIAFVGNVGGTRRILIVRLVPVTYARSCQKKHRGCTHPRGPRMGANSPLPGTSGI